MDVSLAVAREVVPDADVARFISPSDITDEFAPKRNMDVAAGVNTSVISRPRSLTVEVRSGDRAAVAFESGVAGLRNIVSGTRRKLSPISSATVDAGDQEAAV